MKVGSLFTGIGGFDLGLERAGIEVAWQCEIDPHARAVLAKHWAGVPCYDDVRRLSVAHVEFVDIISFGSPCQDLSVAGKRAGMAGSRSGLFFEATRLIKEMREASDGRFPTVAVWENVPGAFSSNGGADFGEALDALADSGAVDIAYVLHDAIYGTDWPSMCPQGHAFSRLDADTILYLKLKERGMNEIKARIVYWAVRAFGGGSHWRQAA